MNARVWLVAKRELATRVRTRAFVLGTAALIAVMGGYALFLGFLTSGGSTVGLTGQATAVAKPLAEITRAHGSVLEIRDVADRATGEQQVREGDLDALVAGAPDALTLIVDQDADETIRAALDDIVRDQAVNAELAKNGVDPVLVQRVAENAKVSVTSLQPADPEAGQRMGLAIMAGVVLYMFLIFAGQAVAQGVVEEKSSRVVEVLLATIRPAELLTGKVLGIGLTMLLQFAIIGFVGGLAAAVSGVLALPSATLAGTIAWTAVWTVLGYFFYATILAAAASLVSRMEDLQSVISPVMLLLIVPFILATSLLPSDPESPLGMVLSLVPGFAPIWMPMRIALDVAAPWEIAVSLVLSFAAGFGLLRLGGRIYSNTVLRTGARVSISEALRLR